MIKAVLFDMDGVLYDSMPGHVQAWHQILSEAGISVEPEEFYLHEGRTGRATLQIYFQRAFGRDITDAECRDLYARKTQRFVDWGSHTCPMPGAWETLQKVKDLGLQRLLVTGSGQNTLLEALNTHFPGHFDPAGIVTAADVQFGKPHPEPYRMGLQKGHLLPEEAFVVENAPLGIQSARAAGIYTIAVNTGPLPDSVLQEAGANMVLPSMCALAEQIESLVTNFSN
jgi:HAD superfamily hydrolase (TIGR01509 family)